jgi:hypothetical protein
LAPERRQALLEQLSSELTENTKPNGPVVFEIPVGPGERIDVLVVWAEWEGLRSEDRTDLILEAYNGQRDRIAQALGVTYEEAKEQQLLPYAVLPMIRRGEPDQDVRKAMLEEGGIALPGERVELRFPTMSMAEAAHRNLCNKLPRGYWSIAQTAAPIP